MMTEKAKVVAVEEDGLWVETYNASACDACSAKPGCGQSLLAAAAMGNMTRLKVYFVGTVRHRIWSVGDDATIGITEAVLLKSTLVIYFLPIVCLVFAAVVSSSFNVSDGLVAFCAMAGLLVGGGIVRWHAGQVRCSRHYHATVLDD